MLSKLNILRILLKTAILLPVRDPDSLRYAYPWFRSMFPGHVPLGDEVPWITFKAITWLQSYLKPQMTVFEYGSGGSTLFLSRRVRKLVSVEHDRVWFNGIAAELAAGGITNCDYLLREPETCDSDDSRSNGSDRYTSTKARYENSRFEQYVKSIDPYPNKTFDLVVIDGRSRVSCVSRALSKVRSNGYLMLDDSHRGAYHRARSLLSDFQRTDFAGIGPYKYRRSKTTIWQIPATGAGEPC